MNPLDQARKATENARRAAKLLGGVSSSDNSLIADFRGEYSVGNYAAHELNAFQGNAPTSVVDRVANSINTMFSSTFANLKSNNPLIKSKTFSELVETSFKSSDPVERARAGVFARNVSQTVRNTPFDISGIVGGAFPPANGVSNYGDAIDMITQASGGGFIDRSKRMSQVSNQNFFDVYQTSAVAFAQSVVDFNGKTSFSRFGSQQGFYAVEAYMQNDKNHGASGKMGLEGILEQGTWSSGSGTSHERVSIGESGVPLADIGGWDQASLKPQRSEIDAIMVRASGSVGTMPGLPQLTNLPRWQQGLVADWLENGESVALNGQSGSPIQFSGVSYRNSVLAQKQLDRPMKEEDKWIPPTWTSAQRLNNLDVFDAEVGAATRWPRVGDAPLDISPDKEGALPFLPEVKFNPYDAVADSQATFMSGKVMKHGERAVQESFKVGERFTGDPTMLARQVYDYARVPSNYVPDVSLPATQDIAYNKMVSDFAPGGTSAAIVRGGDATGYAKTTSGVDPVSGKTYDYPNPVTRWMTPEQRNAANRAQSTMYNIGKRYNDNMGAIRSAVSSGKLSYQDYFTMKFSGKDRSGYASDVNRIAEEYNIPLRYQNGVGEKDAAEKNFVAGFNKLPPEQQAILSSASPSTSQQMKWAEAVVTKKLGQKPFDLEGEVDKYVSANFDENGFEKGDKSSAGTPRRSTEPVSDTEPPDMGNGGYSPVAPAPRGPIMAGGPAHARNPSAQIPDITHQMNNGVGGMIRAEFPPSPNEQGGLMIGNYDAAGNMTITGVRRAQNARATPTSLNFSDVMAEILPTLQPGEEVVGDIHTHTGQASVRFTPTDANGDPNVPGSTGVIGSQGHGSISVIHNPDRGTTAVYARENGTDIEPISSGDPANGYTQGGPYSQRANQPPPNNPPPPNPPHNPTPQPNPNHGPYNNGFFSTPNYMSGYAQDNRRLGSFNSPTHGTYGNFMNPTTGQMEMGIGRNGTISIDQQTIGMAQDIAGQVISQSVSGPMPDSDEDRSATIVSRSRSGIRSHIKALETQLQAGGMDPANAKELAAAVKEVTSHILNVSTRSLTSSMGATTGNNFTNGDVSNLATNAVKVSTEKLATNVAASRPQLADALLQQAGLTPQEAAKLPVGQEVVMNDPQTGTPYSFGQVSAGGWTNNGGGGNTGGSIGRAFYGAYQLKKLYDMGLGPEMQKANQYGYFMNSTAQTAYYGAGTDYSQSQAGYAGRSQMGQDYLAKGAFEQFGGFSELPFMMSGAGDGASRILSSVTAAGTIAVGGYIAGSMMVAGGMGGAVAAALGPVGVGVGVGILAGTGFMEGINSRRPVGSEPITFSSVLRDTAQSSSRKRAVDNYVKSNPLAAAKYMNPFGGGTADNPIGTIGQPINQDAVGDYTKAWSEIDAVDPSGLRSGLSISDRTYADYKYNPKIDDAVALAQTLKLAGFDEGSSNSAISILSRAGGGAPSSEDVVALKNNSISANMQPNALAEAASSFAQGMGFISGTPSYYSTQKSYQGASEEQRSRLDYQSARLRSLSGMIEGNYTSDAQGIPSIIMKSLGIDTTMQASTANSMQQSYQAFTGDASAGNNNQLMMYSTRVNSYVGGAISSAMQLGGMAGMSSDQIRNTAGALSGAGMSNQQAFMFNNYMQGDLKAFSFSAWQNPAMDSKWKLYDQSGNSIFDTNGKVGVEAYRGWQETFHPGVQMGSNDQTLDKMGMTDPTMRDQYLNGYKGQFGNRGVALAHSDQMYGYQMAGIGIQAQGIALQQSYLWGTGTWNNPASGSSWDLENQSRSLQNSQQQWQFGFSEKSMNVQNTFAIARENISQQQMNLSQTQTNWSMGASRNQSLMQRGWAKEDYQYQDTTRNLSNEWQMQDYAYNIRYATGRQRQQLVREQGRAALSFNLESEQIDKTRDRQKETWSLEDERYNKEKNYTLELQSLDRQSWQLSKDQRVSSFNLDKEQLAKKVEDYKKEYALQTEIINSQRKYQMEQIELQKASVGIQAAAAAAQKTYEDNMLKTNNTIGDFTGKLQELNSYDNAFRLMNSLNALMSNIDTGDVSKPNALTSMSLNINLMSIDKISKLIDLIRELKGMNSIYDANHP